VSALQRLTVAQQQQQVQPEASWRHKIEPSSSGGFIAFWESKAVYAKGHMLRLRRLHVCSWLNVILLEKSSTKLNRRDFPFVLDPAWMDPEKLIYLLFKWGWRGPVALAIAILCIWLFSKWIG